jgi:hypothetical protein
MPNYQYKLIKISSLQFEMLPLLSRGWRFSGYSFSTVCIEPAGLDAGLYTVLQDYRAHAEGEGREQEEASESKNLRNNA